MIYYLIACIVIAIDQISKWIIIQTMDVYDQISIIDGFFRITSHRNKGAAWGILQNQMMFFYIITIIVVIGIVYYMEKHAKQHKLLGVALSFILGGALGNFIDRLIHKEVVDFLDFNIFGYEYPIFNFADSFLVIGVILVVIFTFYDERKKGKINS